MLQMTQPESGLSLPQSADVMHFATSGSCHLNPPWPCNACCARTFPAPQTKLPLLLMVLECCNADEAFHRVLNSLYTTISLVRFCYRSAICSRIHLCRWVHLQLKPPAEVDPTADCCGFTYSCLGSFGHAANLRSLGFTNPKPCCWPKPL